MKPINRLFDLLELYRDEYASKEKALCFKAAGTWQSYSSEEYVRYSNLVSLGLLSLGIGRGSRVATIMVNSPEWNFFDMGIQQTGAIPIPIYPTISEESFRYILNDAGIEYLVVSNSEIYCRVRNLSNEIPSLKGIFSIDKIRGVRHWKEIIELGKKHSDPSVLDKIKATINETDLATIIYTSGTTGTPKGVMLSHRNFISNFTESARIPDFNMNDRVVSFLPLCHVYERMLNYLWQYFGMSVYYVDSLDKVMDAVHEVKPHAFAAVPRVLEKIYARAILRGRGLIEPRKALFFWAVRQGHKFEFNHSNGPYYDLKLFLAYILVLRKWRKALGGNIKLIISGGASLHPKLAKFYWAARIPVMEGYGLTETSPVIAVSTFEPGGVRFGFVGPVLRGVEVRIAPDGEILCRGPNVMLGYYNRPERTKEVIDEEGWFHTGDIGELEDGKYLKITDRKKEIFKTSTGKYIAPAVIEQRLKESPFIEHVMVLGENRQYTAALIVPNFEHIKNWCEVKHISFVSNEKAARNKRVIKRVREEVDHFNLDLGNTEKIKKFRLIAEVWSVESGELSPTMKLRRKFIYEKYQQVIDEMYHSPEFNYKFED